MADAIARFLKPAAAVVAVVLVAIFIFDWASLATPPNMTSRTSVFLWVLAAFLIIAVAVR
jgi:hypothetical protein